MPAWPSQLSGARCFGPAMCNQPHRQQLAEAGAGSGGCWGKGGLLRAGFREDKCRTGALSLSRRGVVLWGGLA